MKIKVYFFGKSNEVTSWEEKYLKRISFNHKIEILALPQAGVKDELVAKEKEAQNLLARITTKDFLVALDEHGKTFNSVGFSNFLAEQEISTGQIVFVVGGAYGLHELVLRRANKKISLGKMVWTRELARLMLLEQVYRGFEILRGSNFHKE